MAAAVAKFAEAFGVTHTAGSGSWTEVTSIAAADLEASKNYLILVGGNYTSTSTTVETHVRIMRGTTDLTAEGIQESDLNASTDFITWGLMARDTQPATAEKISVEIRTTSGSQTATCDAWIWVLKLSDDFTENTDFYWNELTTDAALATTAEAKAAVTFTPNGTDDWLVIGHAVIDPSSSAVSYNVSLHDSVEAADQPLIISEGEDTTNSRDSKLLMRVYTPSNASHTFSVRAWESGGTGTHLVSRIFALNLSKFAQHAKDYTLAEIDPGTTFSTVATVAPTPDVTGDWFFFGWCIIDLGAVTNSTLVRMQANPDGGGLVSRPGYGDDAPATGSYDNRDEQPVIFFHQRSFTSGAARTINLDAQRASGTTQRIEDRQLVAFSLELAGAGTAHELASAIAGTGTVTPALTGAFVFSSQIDAIATVTPTLTPTRNLAAQIDALATVSPTLSAFKELQAQINAAGTVTGETTLALVLASQVDGIATVVPSLTGAFVFASQIDGVATVTPSLTASHPLLSQINAVGAVSPTLSAFTGLASQIDAIATVTPVMMVGYVLNTTISTQATVIPVFTAGTEEPSFVSGFNWLHYTVKKGK